MKNKILEIHNFYILQLNKQLTYKENKYNNYILTNLSFFNLFFIYFNIYFKLIKFYNLVHLLYFRN